MISKYVITEKCNFKPNANALILKRYMNQNNQNQYVGDDCDCIIKWKKNYNMADNL
jgi:hypothetical protein